ncbi:MAG: hypothetical protein ABI680_16095 [Chthoniobacteraceae bacterium]
MDDAAEEPSALQTKGPAWRAAEEYGRDMSLVEDSLRKTAQERIQDHQSALDLALSLRKAYVEQHGGPAETS